MTTYDRDYGRPVTVEEAKLAFDAAEQASVGGPLVSPSIESLSAYPPSRPWREVAVELGLPESEIMLLAANENVLGPSPLAVEAAKDAIGEVNLYPDGACSGLKSSIAAHLDVPTDRLVVGNGSNEIIELLIRTFVLDGETVVTAWPSFVVYRLAAQAHGRDAILAPLRRDRYDLGALAALVDHRTKLLFIANPNNPTGTYVPRRALAAFLDRLPKHVIVVLDEAYIEYTDAEDFPNGLLDFAGRSRLVVLRTFSKIYGLAGMRVGFGVMDPELADYIERVRQPYNVNAVAQAAAAAAIGDTDHVAQSRAVVREGMAQLAEGLTGAGLEFVPSQANFMVVKLPCEGAGVQAALRERGILVRAMGGYGMPRSIRVTVGTTEMNRRVLDALAAIVPEQSKV